MEPCGWNEFIESIDFSLCISDGPLGPLYTHWNGSYLALGAGC